MELEVDGINLPVISGCRLLNSTIGMQSSEHPASSRYSFGREEARLFQQMSGTRLRS